MMKVINNVLIPLSFFSTFCYSAGTEIEIKQLQEINDRSFEKMEVARREVNEAIEKQIKNTPERQGVLLDLKKSWESTIQKKCIAEIYESLSTDGEIAYKNDCLFREYQQEKTFFDNTYP